MAGPKPAALPLGDAPILIYWTIHILHSQNLMSRLKHSQNLCSTLRLIEHYKNAMTFACVMVFAITYITSVKKY